MWQQNDFDRWHLDLARFFLFHLQALVFLIYFLVQSGITVLFRSSEPEILFWCYCVLRMTTTKHQNELARTISNLPSFIRIVSIIAPHTLNNTLSITLAADQTIQAITIQVIKFKALSVSNTLLLYFVPAIRSWSWTFFFYFFIYCSTDFHAKYKMVKYIWCGVLCTNFIRKLLWHSFLCFFVIDFKWFFMGRGIDATHKLTE